MSLLKKVASVTVFATVAFTSLSEAQRRDKMLLVLPPMPSSLTDSAYAVALADEVRDRMDSKFRFKLRIVPKSAIAEALQASGFGPDALLDAEAVDQLANFLQSDAYMVGALSDGNGEWTLNLRLVDLRRSGLAGLVSVSQESGVEAEDFAKDVVDSLEDRVDAAKHARECIDRRDRQDYKGARDRAERAFEVDPNHPAAAICMADVFEASEAPNDSVITMLERASRGDSLNHRIWERLGRLYQERGDTTLAVQAFEKQLTAEPSDARLRLGVAAMHGALGNYERARDYINDGLERNPADLPTLRMKARLCVEGELWGCALEAFDAQYELDSSLVGDTVFYAQALGAAQQLEDTTAALRWSEEAVDHAPDNLSLWRARAASLRDAGRFDEALAAYDRIRELNPNDLRAMLAQAQVLLEGTVIDSAVPLDTARLDQADTLLVRVLEQSDDPGLRQNIAALYFQPGATMAQKQMAFRHSVRFLEQSLANDIGNQFSTNANFFLGLAYFLYIAREFDAQVRESESCDMVEREAEMLSRGREALITGSSVSPETAERLLGFYEQFEAFIPQFRAAWQCS